MFFQQKQFFSDIKTFELKYETFPFIEAILGPFCLHSRIQKASIQSHIFAILSSRENSFLKLFAGIFLISPVIIVLS